MDNSSFVSTVDEGEIQVYHPVNFTGTNFSQLYFIRHPHQHTKELSYLSNVLDKFDNYVFPSLFTVGVIFNTLLIFVSLRTDLKKITTFLVIACLGITDNVYLVTKMIHWGSKKVHPINNKFGVCQIFYYASFLTIFMEWWMIAFLLSERVAHLFKPIASRKIYTPFRVKCALLVFSVFAIVAHLYHTWTIAVIEFSGHSLCMIIPENSRNIFILRKVDTIFSFFMPVCAICMLLSAGIYKCVINTTTTTKDLHSEPSIRTPIVDMDSLQPKYIMRARVQQMMFRSYDYKHFQKSRTLSVYCFVMSGIFLVLCIPHDVMRAKMSLSGRVTMLQEALLIQLFSEIYAINFASKGLFFLIASPEYRHSCVSYCKELFTCHCSKKDNKVQQTQV